MTTALSSEQAWSSATATAGAIFAGAAVLWLLWLIVAPRLVLDERLNQVVGPGLLVTALLVSMWATRNAGR